MAAATAEPCVAKESSSQDARALRNHRNNDEEHVALPEARIHRQIRHHVGQRRREGARVSVDPEEDNAVAQRHVKEGDCEERAAAREKLGRHLHMPQSQLGAAREHAHQAQQRWVAQ
jgi:hypothetical protein